MWPSSEERAKIGTNKHGSKVDSLATNTSASSAERFGYEWDKYSEVLREHEEQFRRWTTALQPQEWRGLTFLDVGCGMGRNSYWPMRYGAAGGLAIDVDERSLSAARRTLARFPAVRVELRSAYAIGCRDEFDLVFSIGVIHHLEHPERALANMVEAVKPGGRILIWLDSKITDGSCFCSIPCARCCFPGCQLSSWITYRFIPPPYCG
jgi:2-polyprenyl-3-methyl-5-hydroxy-6-metoxy-1,4-benzoquinol methylase